MIDWNSLVTFVKPFIYPGIVILIALFIGIIIIFYMFKKSKYEIKTICDNCGFHCVVKIPKGETIQEFLKENQGECNYCGCDKFSMYFKAVKGGK